MNSKKCDHFVYNKRLIIILKKLHSFLENRVTIFENFYKGKHWNDAIRIVFEIFIKFEKKRFCFLNMKNFSQRQKAARIMHKFFFNKIKHYSPNTLLMKLYLFKKFIKIVIAMSSLPNNRNFIKRKQTLKEFLDEEIPIITKNIRHSKEAHQRRKLLGSASKMIVEGDISQIINNFFFKNGFKVLINLPLSYYQICNFRKRKRHCNNNIYTPTDLRDILIFLLIVWSSARCKMIHNLTLEDFLTMKQQQQNQDGQIFFLLNCAKSNSGKNILGNDYLLIPHNIKVGLNSYVKHIRPLFLREEEKEEKDGRLFISLNCKGVLSIPSISKNMKCLAQKCGLQNKNFTSTANRRGTIIETMESHLDLDEKLLINVNPFNKTFQSTKPKTLAKTFIETIKGKYLVDFSKNLKKTINISV